MSKMLTIFNGSTGLNTKTDPSRIRFDGQNGISDLAVAYNVCHDDTGRVSRRKGYTATAISSACHSLWAGRGDICLFVTGTSLCRLAADYSYTVLTTVTAGAAVRYAQISDRVYWVNGHEVGKLTGGLACEWTVGTYYGPETKRRFSPPPAGHLVCYHQGRIFVGHGSVIWYSEPYSDNLFDFARNYLPFEGRLRMIASVGQALYISDDSDTYVLLGSLPHDFALKKVCDHPVIEGTESVIDLNRVDDGNFNGIGLIWVGAQGVCIGTSDGTVFNLTRKKNDIPAANSGAGLVIASNYISTIR